MRQLNWFVLLCLSLSFAVVVEENLQAFLEFECSQQQYCREATFETHKMRVGPSSVLRLTPHAGTAGRQGGAESAQLQAKQSCCAPEIASSITSERGGGSSVHFGMTVEKYQTTRHDIKDLVNSGLLPFLADITDGRQSHTPAAILGAQLTKSFEASSMLREKLDNETLDCAILALAKSGEHPKLLRRSPGCCFITFT